MPSCGAREAVAAAGWPNASARLHVRWTGACRFCRRIRGYWLIMGKIFGM